MISDISKIKKIELSAIQEKSRFFSSIAHELRTPLNAIIPMTMKLRSSDQTK